MSTIESCVCPVCNGTLRMKCPDHLRKYGVSHGWYGYDIGDDTVSCNNCGQQYMMGRATGRVRANRNGEPCAHEYTSSNAGRCLTRYVCKHCDEEFDIDSSD